EDLGLQVRRHGEGQPDVHAGGIALDGRVEEFLDLGEGDDLVELAVDLGLAHAEDGAVHVDVLAARELGVEAGADLQEGGEAAAEPRRAGGGLDDAAEDLQEGRLAGAVAADDADDLAPGDLEGDILQRPERMILSRLPAPVSPEEDIPGGLQLLADGLAQAGG